MKSKKLLYLNGRTKAPLSLRANPQMQVLGEKGARPGFPGVDGAIIARRVKLADGVGVEPCPCGPRLLSKQVARRRAGTIQAWRSGGDSNPENLAVLRLSGPLQYHSATAPYRMMIGIATTDFVPGP